MNHASRLPEDFYLQAVNNVNNQVYIVDRQNSQIMIKVYRDGFLASLGHDHIVASLHLQGYVLINRSTGTCQSDFVIPIQQLIVDDEVMRKQALMKTTPTQNDILATQKNMLKSLNSNQFNYILLHSDNCFNAILKQTTKALLTLNGITNTLQLDIKQQQNKQNLLIRGSFYINQTDFNIQPFSVFNGLLKVQDKVDISYSISASQLIQL